MHTNDLESLQKTTYKTFKKSGFRVIAVPNVKNKPKSRKKNPGY
jgi:glutathione peroxidase-family protein